MPTFDFHCKDCGNKFEELVLLSQMDKLKCPKCGGSCLERVYEGRWMGGAGTSKCDGCSGNCASCKGCSHH